MPVSARQEPHGLFIQPIDFILFMNMTPKLQAHSVMGRARNTQKGFTLTELIVVIAVLGILAATAMPKYLNMRREARIAVLQGLAGSIRSAQQLSLAAFKLKNDEGSTITLADGKSVLIETNKNLPAFGTPMATLSGLPVMLGCDTTTSLGKSVLDSNIYNCNGIYAGIDPDAPPSGGGGGGGGGSNLEISIVSTASFSQLSPAEMAQFPPIMCFLEYSTLTQPGEPLDATIAIATDDC